MVTPHAHPTGHGNCLKILFPQAFSGRMCRFVLRIQEADFKCLVEEAVAATWWVGGN